MDTDLTIPAVMTALDARIADIERRHASAVAEAHRLEGYMLALRDMADSIRNQQPTQDLMAEGANKE